MKRMRSIALVGALALGLLVLCMSLAQGGRPSSAATRSAATATIRVCTAGLPACDYASLQAAVDAAADGDLILVILSFIDSAIYFAIYFTIVGVGQKGDNMKNLGNRMRLILVGCGLPLGLLLLWIGLAQMGSASVAAPAMAPAAEIRVCTDGPPTCDYASLQAAVDAAADGDLIKVAVGTYTDVSARGVPSDYFRGSAGDTSVITQVVYIDKSVTIRGGYTAIDYTNPPDPQANPTILDAQGQARVVMIVGEVNPILEGLHITGGDAKALGGHEWAMGSDAGGGVHVLNATATIRDCKIHNNAANFGGGVFVHFGAATVESNDIYSNTANWGGGLSLSQSPSTVISNTISGNVVNQQNAPGGGIVPNRGAGVDLVENSDAHVAGNTIVGNTADQEGGGLAVQGGAATIENNIIKENDASYGGGVHLADDATVVTSNVITANTAITSGGGLYLLNSSTHAEFNTIQWNGATYGGGAYVDCNQAPDNSHAVFGRSDFFYNFATDTGGGIATEFCAHTSLADNVFSYNSAPNGGGISWFITDGDLRENVVALNSADRGGGIYMHGPGQPVLINTLVADNQATQSGSGLYLLGAYPRLVHSTVAQNSGGDGSGIFVENWVGYGGPANVVLTNTIVSSHTVGISVTAGNTVTVNAMLWHNNPITLSQASGAVVAVQNQALGDPNFQNPGVGDFHLGNLSLARDAGLEVGVDRDLDGHVRPMGWGADLGADEFPDAAFQILVEPGAAGVNRGQSFTYDVVVTNTGLMTANNVLLTDTLPLWQRPTAVSPVASCTIVDGGWGGRVVCTELSLVPDAAMNLQLTTEVSPAVDLGQGMINAVEVTADETSEHVQAETYAQDCHARVDGGGTEYDSVQAAVDAAGSGDLIKVAGYCAGAFERGDLRQQVYLDKSLTLRGGYTTADWTAYDPQANPTTLDALGLGRVLYVAEGTGATLEGLRVTGGDAAGLGGMGDQGAGGGVFALGPWLTLNESQVFSNAAFSGAGLWIDSQVVTLRGNSFFSNTANFCGGLYVGPGSATLVGNTVTANATSEWSGGGLCVDGNTATLRRNRITGNVATGSAGGLLVMFGSDVRLVNNVIADNQASLNGNGLRVLDSSAKLLHNTIARNNGGDGVGVYVDGSNPGSTVDMVNTIFVTHSVGFKIEGGSAINLDGVLWYDSPIHGSQSPTATVTLHNELVGDPAFESDGYHITTDSLAIDAGVNAGVRGDIDLDARPVGLGYDLGADEVPPPPAKAEPDGGTLVLDDATGLTTTLALPAGAVSETTTVAFRPKALEALEGAPFGLAFGARAFEIEAYQNQSGQPVSGFGTPVTLVLRYTDADVFDVFEDTLVPQRWTGSAWEEIGTRPGEGYLLEPEINRLTLYLLGFSRFGSLGTAVERHLYLPLMLQAE